MYELLFCPQHGLITANWPMVLIGCVTAKLYAHRVITVVLRWF